MAAANPLKWVINWLNADDEEEDPDTMSTSNQPPTSTKATPQSAPRRQRGPMMLHHDREGGMEIRHPRSMDERMVVGNDLKQRRIVTLDLTKLSELDARYFLEFVYGVAFALDAAVEKVTDGIFLIIPRGIAVHNDIEADVIEPTVGTTSRVPTGAASSVGAEQEEFFWAGR